MSNKDKKDFRTKGNKSIHSKLRKRIFVENLLNPNNKNTFCNITQAAKAAYPKAGRQTAATLGHNLTKQPYVMNEIERVIEENDIGFSNRVTCLRDIIYGNVTRSSVRLVRNDSGAWCEVEKAIIQPTFTERINAMKVLNQIDGTDKKASNIVSEQRKLMSEMRKKLLKDLDFESKADKQPSINSKNLIDKMIKKPEKIDSEAIMSDSNENQEDFES